MLLHPTPNSVMFWDMTVLFGYLLLNIIIGWVTLEAARNDVKPPKWIKVLIYISIIWAFSIHTVTGLISIGQTLVLATRKHITAMFLIIKMESGTMDSSQRIIQ